MSRTFLALLVCGGVALGTGCDEKKVEPTVPAPAPAEVPSPPPATQGTAGATGQAAPPAAVPAGKGTVKGAVAFSGKTPEKKMLNRAGDPVCAKTQVAAEDVLVNGNGTLKNVIVRLMNVPGTYEPPKDALVVEQEDCMYRPRVQTALAGQTILVKNGDKTLHNVHTYRGSVTLANKAQLAGSPPIEMKFTDEFSVIKFKCDAHPWMEGYVSITKHPFVAVTGNDGSFELKDVPAGTYKLEAWHEELGTKTMDVTIAANGVAEAKFSYDGTEKP